jgi:hypothetical protein
MATIDISFLRTNPIKLLIAFIIFYYFIAQPFFDMEFMKSVLFFALFFFLYKKYGNNALSKFKIKGGSMYGRSRRH